MSDRNPESGTEALKEKFDRKYNFIEVPLTTAVCAALGIVSSGAASDIEFEVLLQKLLARIYQEMRMAYQIGHSSGDGQHLPVPVREDGAGPVDEEAKHHDACFCGYPFWPCPLDPNYKE